MFLKDENMTRDCLEVVSGINHGHMQRIMKDKRKNITLKSVAMIANGFGLTLSQFFDDPIFDFSNFDVEDN